MVVQYKEIDDIIDEKYTDEVVFKYIQELILATEKAKKALGDDGEAFNVERNEKLVMQAVIDAVEDLKRIHDFHPIEDANAIKEAAYFSFRLIKRKPMCFTGNLSEISGSSKEEIDKRKVNILFINEFCAAIYIMPKIFRLKKEVKELDKAYPNMDKLSNDWKKYFDNLIYFLSYRAESPKSIEAALTSLIMTPKWETNFDFWKVDEKK